MIELEWGQHLIDSLTEFGPSLPGFSGPVAVTYQEIEAWARTTKTNIPGHEVLELRRLSQIFCNEYYKSDKPGRPMPQENEMTEEGRAKVASSFRQLIKSLKKDDK